MSAAVCCNLQTFDDISYACLMTFDDEKLTELRECFTSQNVTIVTWEGRVGGSLADQMLHFCGVQFKKCTF